MESEQQEEWNSLAQRAKQQLRSGNAPTRSGVKPLFQLLILPSFTAESGWEICQDTKAAPRYFVVRSLWHKEADLSKLETPVVRLRYPRPLVPTIEVRNLPLESAWVEATLQALKSLVIPALVEAEPLGCDGTAYELAFDAGFVQARYGWWEEPPAGWRPLHRWLQQTLKVLEQLKASE